MQPRRSSHDQARLLDAIIDKDELPLQPEEVFLCLSCLWLVGIYGFTTLRYLESKLKSNRVIGIIGDMGSCSSRL